MKRICEDCEEEFDNRTAFLKHRRNIHPPPSVKCQKCDTELKNARCLKAHLEKKIPCDFDFKCEECGKQLKDRDAWYNHMRNTHGMMTKQQIIQLEETEIQQDNIGPIIEDELNIEIEANDPLSDIVISPPIFNINISINKKEKGIVYLLREPNSPSNNWKIGQTGNTIEERIGRGSYKRGTMPKYQAEVYDCLECERAIKLEFKKHFKQLKGPKGGGSEWFEGDGEEMIDVMRPIIKKYQ